LRKTIHSDLRNLPSEAPTYLRHCLLGSPD
jgi:hypothetical protein